MVCSDMDFNECEIIRVGDDVLPVNMYKSDVALDYGSTYYWRVRAASAGGGSTWSFIGVFVTESEPDEDTEPNPTTTLILEPTFTTYTALTSSTVYKTVVSTLILKPVVEPPPSPMPISNQPNSDVPGWFYYAMGSAGAFIVILLAVIMVLLTRRRL